MFLSESERKKVEKAIDKRTINQLKERHPEKDRNGLKLLAENLGYKIKFT